MIQSITWIAEKVQLINKFCAISESKIFSWENLSLG